MGLRSDAIEPLLGYASGPIVHADLAPAPLIL